MTPREGLERDEGATPSSTLARNQVQLSSSNLNIFVEPLVFIEVALTKEITKNILVSFTVALAY